MQALQTGTATAAAAGRLLTEMYFIIDDDCRPYSIGRIIGIKGRGRNLEYTVMQFHPDPIAAGQPDAGETTFGMEDLIEYQIRFFPTFAEAMASIADRAVTDDGAS